MTGVKAIMPSRHDCRSGQSGGKATQRLHADFPDNIHCLSCLGFTMGIGPFEFFMRCSLRRRARKILRNADG